MAGGFCAAAEMPVDEAWKALPAYQYGQDMAPLLAIDRAVIQAMASPATRTACAARLASLLESPTTTAPARQYICFQLRQIGTPAQVPLLSRLLQQADTSEMARQALEAIPGEASLATLREALNTLKDKQLVAVISSVAARHDVQSVAKLCTLADAADKPVAAAALWALGNIANDEAIAFLTDRAAKAGTPAPKELAVPLVRSADALAAAGKTAQAQAIYDKLSQTGQLAGVRRAALDGLLRLQKAQRAATILAWFQDADADRRELAAGYLKTLSNEQLDQAAAELGKLSAGCQRTLIEVLAARRGKEALPLVLTLAKSDKADLKLAGVRCLAMVNDPSTIPLLVDTLAAGDELTKAAQQSLGSLPRKEVVAALLDALNSRPADRGPVIEVLTAMKCFEAIDPLVAIAAQDDPAVYGPALDGLRGIADPDKTDIPRLVKLLAKTEPGKHRDEVEKTILIVCGKLPAGADRSEPVLAALAGSADTVRYLPLLGRLGGAKARKQIEAALASPDPSIQEAAVAALCNWPNADVADRLLALATQGPNEASQRRALRAYVRVVTLKSDRPEAQTLGMLQNAMKLATEADDRRLIVQRASTVRTMESVQWVASYLDDPALAQAACVAVVELAHHRFLRHPNMARFTPILEKVSRLSTDPQIVERAKRYRLGL
jgi:HEAT repeat protein